MEPLTWPESKMTGEVKPHNLNNAANFMREDKSKCKANEGTLWMDEEYEDMAQMYRYASTQFQSRP